LKKSKFTPAEMRHNRSADDWAEFFVQTVRDNSPEILDLYNEKSIHDTMRAWFASAMMAMHDSLKAELKDDFKDM